MKDVTVLICWVVDLLCIFVSFSSWFNSRNFNTIFWTTWLKSYSHLAPVFWYVAAWDQNMGARWEYDLNQIVIWKYCYKMFWLLVFLLHSKKKRNSSSKTLQIAHSLWSLGILRFLPISVKSVCSLSLNFEKISPTFLSGCDK